MSDKIYITVDTDGMMDNVPIPKVSDWTRINRKLNKEEKRAYDIFVRLLEKVNGKRVELTPGYYDDYTARIYEQVDGAIGEEQLFVSSKPGRNEVNYSYYYCPLIHKRRSYTHKDIEFVWVQGNPKFRGIMEMDREIHKANGDLLGNGTYYLIRAYDGRVFRKEDD